MWCLCGEAGPPLRLDQRLHRYGRLWQLKKQYYLKCRRSLRALTSTKDRGVKWISHQHICRLPGARNHHYFVLFLFSLMMMGAWMFYGCIVCEWLNINGLITASGKVLDLDRIKMLGLCVFFRLVDSLRAALWGSGPVGSGVWPGQLLSMAAQHLPAGLLSRLLVRLGPGDTALPGDSLLVPVLKP